jgi:hypothetical protein
MPTFIKTGYWEKIQKGYKGWLNLDDIVNGSIGTGTTNRLPKYIGPNTLGDSIISATSTLVSNNFGTSNLYFGQSGSTRFGYAAGTATLAFSTNLPLVIGTYDGMPLVFGTNNAENIRIFTDGNVGVGTGNNNAGYKLNVNGTARFQSDVLISGSTQPLSVVGTFANKNAIRFSTENGVAGAIRLTDYYTSKVSNRPALEIYGTDNTDTLSTIPAISIISDSVTIGSTLKAGTYDWNTSSNKQFNYPTNAARYIFALSSSTGYNTHEAFLYRIGYSNVTPASRVSVAWTHSTDLSARYFYYDGLSQFGTSLASAPTANPTAYVDIVASTTTAASLRIRSGVAPTAPNDGDIWFDGTALRIRIAGVTRTINVT